MSMPGLVGGAADLWNVAPDPLHVGRLPREFLWQTCSLGWGLAGGENLDGLGVSYSLGGIRYFCFCG